jgi:hypothetical protein
VAQAAIIPGAQLKKTEKKERRKRKREMKSTRETEGKTNPTTG